MNIFYVPLFDNLRSEKRFKEIINKALAKKSQLRKEIQNYLKFER